MIENANRKIHIPFKACEDTPYIFASYSHDDKDLVYPIISKIYEAGWNIWYDEGIEIDSEYDDVIANHIVNCDLFILFVSNSSVKSEYIRNFELKFAIRNKKKILTYWIENVLEIPSGIEMLLIDSKAVTDATITSELGGIQNYGQRKAIGHIRELASGTPDINADWEYVQSSNGVKITKYKGHNKVVGIPSTINGMPVTQLGGSTLGGVFKDNGEVETIFIPECVEHIGPFVFANCRSLKSLIIPRKVKSLACTFFGCTSMEYITIHEGVTHMESDMFRGSSLPLIQCVKDSYAHDFARRFGMRFELYEPEKEDAYIQALLDGTEELPESIKEAEIPVSELIAAFETAEPDREFYADATNTKNIVWCNDAPYAVLSVHRDDIYTILPIISELYSRGFNIRSCENEDEIGRAKLIMSKNCKLFLPCVTKSYTNSDMMACDFGFAEESGKPFTIMNLEQCSYPAALAMRYGSKHNLCLWEHSSNDMMARIEEQLKQHGCFISDSEGKIKARSFNLPDISYKLIEDGSSIEICDCDEGCDSVKIEREYFGLKVKSIGEFAFSRCSFSIIEIPDTVTTIAHFAFSDLKKAKSIRLPEGIESIGDCAFKDCICLEKLYLPRSVKSIGSNVFENCPNLTVVCSPFSYAWRYCKEKGVHHSIV